MTYTWSIIKLKTRDVVNAEGVTLSDAVVSVQWIKTGVDDDGNGAQVVGWFEPSADNVGASDFVAFTDLTESAVAAWVEAGIDPDLNEAYNNKILEKIKEQAAVERAVPWS